MNNIVLSGNLTKDAELSFLKGSGTAVIKYTIAVAKNSNRKESQFINITTFGKAAESLVSYMLKGTKVGIVGELQVNTKKNDEGKTNTYVSIVTSNVEFLGGKKKESDQFNDNKDFGEYEEPIDDGSMPF